MSREAAVALIRLAARAVREADGELARDQRLTTEQYNELTQDNLQVALDGLARRVDSIVPGKQ